MITIHPLRIVCVSDYGSSANPIPGLSMLTIAVGEKNSP